MIAAAMQKAGNERVVAVEEAKSLDARRDAACRRATSNGMDAPPKAVVRADRDRTDAECDLTVAIECCRHIGRGHAASEEESFIQARRRTHSVIFTNPF
jgi:hypothetical protein